MQIKTLKLEDGLTAKWLISGIGQVGGMLKKDVAALLGVDYKTLDYYIRSCGLVTTKLSSMERQKLKKSNVIPLKANNTTIVTAESIDVLVKKIDTPEAWTRYNNLLEAVRNPVKNAELQTEMRGIEGAKQYGKEYTQAISNLEKKVDSLEKLNKQILSVVSNIYNNSSTTKSNVSNLSVQGMFDFLNENSHLLSSNDLKFVVGIEKYFNQYNKLTFKQLKTISNIFTRTSLSI